MLPSRRPVPPRVTTTRTATGTVTPTRTDRASDLRTDERRPRSRHPPRPGPFRLRGGIGRSRDPLSMTDEELLALAGAAALAGSPRDALTPLTALLRPGRPVDPAVRGRAAWLQGVALGAL